MSYTKINSKWTKYLNVRPKRIKLLEENIAQKLHDNGFGNNSLHITPKAQAIKENIDKLNTLKLKILCIKDTIYRVKDNQHNGKTFPNYIFVKKYAEYIENS